MTSCCLQKQLGVSVSMIHVINGGLCGTVKSGGDVKEDFSLLFNIPTNLYLRAEYQVKYDQAWRVQCTVEWYCYKH